MSSKNRDIQTMLGQYQADKSLNINPMSMLLNGVIDAAVMGGIANYDKIFFADSYLRENPSHTSGVKQLRQHIEEQVCAVYVYCFKCACYFLTICDTVCTSHLTLTTLTALVAQRRNKLSSLCT